MRNFEIIDARISVSEALLRLQILENEVKERGFGLEDKRLQMALFRLTENTEKLLKDLEDVESKFTK